MNKIDVLKKIYAYIDGNKTVICTIIWLLIDKGIIHVTPQWMDIVNYVMASLTGISAVDHIRKGYLTSEKGS